MYYVYCMCISFHDIICTCDNHNILCKEGKREGSSLYSMAIYMDASDSQNNHNQLQDFSHTEIPNFCMII